MYDFMTNVNNLTSKFTYDILKSKSLFVVNNFFLINFKENQNGSQFSWCPFLGRVFFDGC